MQSAAAAAVAAAAAAAGESQGNFLFWETAALKQQAVEKGGRTGGA